MRQQLAFRIHAAPQFEQDPALQEQREKIDLSMSIIEYIQYGLRAQGVVIMAAEFDSQFDQTRYGQVTGMARREIIDISHIGKPMVHHLLSKPEKA